MTAITSFARLIITYLALTALILDPRNPRRHSPRQIRQIAWSIKAFGFAVPILIDCHNKIVAGHGRFLAAQFLGLIEVPVIRLEYLTTAQAKAFMIADNRLTEASVWDDRLLAESLKELSEQELDFSIEATGFTVGEIDLRIEGLMTTGEHELDAADLHVHPGDGLYEKAYAAHLITRTDQKSQRQLLAMRLRSRMAYLRQPTPLHIFVVTLRCEHSCPYCQVSRKSTDRSKFDMSEETASRALNIAFQSPSDRIKIEFQGGEPLLNFPLIKSIVLAAKMKGSAVGKKVGFVIASNLALLDDAVLAFCKENDVFLSTSLDGPADLHNKNRPRPGGNMACTRFG